MPSAQAVENAFVSTILEEDPKHSAILRDANYDADTLASVLQGLENSSNVLRHQLLQTVRDNLDTFIDSYAQSYQLHRHLVDLAKQCESSMESVASNTTATVRDALQHHQDALISATNNKNEIEALKKIQRLVDIADACEQSLCADVEASTRHLLQLESALKDLSLNKNDDGVDWSALRAFDLVRLRSTKLREKLVAALEGCIVQAIKFSHAAHTTLDVLRSPAPYFGCFERLEILPEQMAAVKRSLYKNLIRPFFERPGHVNVSGHTLTVGDNDLNHPMSGRQMIDEVDKMLLFFSTYFFGGDDEKNRRLMFGNLIMPELTKMLVDKVLSAEVPTSACDLPTFDSMIDIVHRFEQKCMGEYNFIPPEEVPGILANYVDSIDEQFATKRSEKVLTEGRNVMLRRLYDVEDIETGAAHYQITQTPRLLFLLLSDIASEASSLQNSHPLSAKKMVETVFDLLDFYRAVLPCYHRSHYLSHPAAALTFRNDCFWLAKALKNDLVQRLDGTAALERLESAASRLETLGNTWYEVVLAQRTQVLHALLDKTGGFDGIAENRQRAKESEEAIEQVVDQIQATAPTIRDCIEETLFMKLMGSLVDTVMARLIGDIEHINDIGAEDSSLIAHALNGLLKLIDVFDRPNQSANEAFVMTLVPSWRKFWLLKDLLELNLKDIIAKFHQGELFMFDKSELIGLIRSLFAYTDLRESIIKEIQIGQPGNMHQNPDTLGNAQDNGRSMSRVDQRSTITKSQSSLSMAPQDDDDDMDGWDDEPIVHTELPLSTKTDSETGKDIGNWDDRKGVPLTQTVSSRSMVPKDDDEEMIGWDDDEYVPIISPEVAPAPMETHTRGTVAPKETVENQVDDPNTQREPSRPLSENVKRHDDMTISRSSSGSLSMAPKDDSDGEMEGWDDPADDPIIPPLPMISSKTDPTDTHPEKSKSSLLMLPDEMGEDDWSGWDE